MELQQDILGFDARRMARDLCSAWDQSRRDTYLLKANAELVLSTDEMVWPSVFNNDPEQSAGSPYAGSALPDWLGANFPLWDHLVELKNFLDEQRDSLRPYWIIAVTVVKTGDGKLDINMNVGQTNPASVSSDWKPLGYDVSDSFRLSGLSNCGYTNHEEHRAATNQWQSRLNKFHLFDKAQDALRFKNYSDTRVKEHAPFYVFGIYLVEEIL